MQGLLIQVIVVEMVVMFAMLVARAVHLPMPPIPAAPLTPGDFIGYGG